MRPARFGSVLALAALQALGGAPLALAADKDPNSSATLLEKDAANTGLFSFNYGPTQTPALNLLNVSPSKATLYTSNTPFILAIPSLFDSSGQTSFGIDVSPAYALQGTDHLVTAYKYEHASLPMELWYRMRLELAATTGAASASNPSKIAPSGIALGISSSFLDSSSPITAKLRGQTDSYFKECVTPPHPTGPTLNQRIASANANLISAYWSPLGEAVSKLQIVADAQTIPQAKADADVALEKAPEILAIYRTQKITDGPTLASPERTPTKVVDEATALSELRNLYGLDAAANAADAKRVQADADASEQIADIALEEGLTLGATASMDQERADVAAYLAALTTPGLANRELRRLTKSAAFLAGLPPPIGAPATDLEKRDVQAIATYRGGAVLKELGGLKNDADKTYDTKTVAKAYANLGITDDLTTCVQAATLVAATSFDITGGIGLIEAGKPGALENLYPGGETVWVGFRAPLWRSFENNDVAASDIGGTKSKASYILAGGSIDYQHDTILVTGNATTPLIKADVTGVWLGVEGFTPKFRGALQVGYTDSHAIESGQSQFSSNGFRWETSVGYQLFKGTWLGVSYGTARGSTTKLDDKTTLVTLQFSPPPAAAIFGK